MNTPTVFISHSSQDSEYANGICSFLEKNGIKCWIAPRDIEPGASYPNEITRGINLCNNFLIIITKNSVHSPHVNTETDIAFNANKKIIPFFTEKVELGNSMSYYLARKQWILGYNNIKTAQDILLNSLSDYITEDYQSENNSNFAYNYKNTNVESPASYFSTTKQQIFRGYSKKQLILLGSFTIFLLLFLPIVGLALGVSFWCFPTQIQSILKKNKHTVIAITVSICVFALGWLGFLWYDSYKYEKRTSEAPHPTSEIASPTEPKNVLALDEHSDITSDESPTTSKSSYAINAITTIDNKVIKAKWSITNSYSSVTLNGHINYIYDFSNAFDCRLRLHKRSLEGIIEDENGARIGYFEGKISKQESKYVIEGEFILESKDYSYKHLPCYIEIDDTPTTNKIFNDEINQAND